MLAALAVAAALILPRLLSPETYRPRLEQLLADLTGRSVVIGPMRLHVFPVPGIEADGFTLGEDPAFGAEPFLKADRIDARIRLMPLFSSRLDVLSFDIDKPVAKAKARGQRAVEPGQPAWSGPDPEGAALDGRGSGGRRPYDPHRAVPLGRRDAGSVRCGDRPWKRASDRGARDPADAFGSVHDHARWESI